MKRLWERAVGGGNACATCPSDGAGQLYAPLKQSLAGSFGS